jgi:hypothetical protein
MSASERQNRVPERPDWDSIGRFSARFRRAVRWCLPSCHRSRGASLTLITQELRVKGQSRGADMHVRVTHRSTTRTFLSRLKSARQRRVEAVGVAAHILIAALLEVVIHSFILDDYAVQATPIFLPSPAFLSAGSVGFDVGSRRFSGQRLAAMRTTGSRAFLETPTALARSEIWFHCCANLLLSGAIGQLRSPLIPLRQNGRSPTGITIGVTTFRHSTMAEPITKRAVTVFAVSFAVVPRHSV